MEKSFLQDTRKELQLDFVFHTKSNANKCKREKLEKTIVDIYAPRLGLRPVLLRAQFRKLHPVLSSKKTKSEFESAITLQKANNPTWCREALLVRSKLCALGQTTVETERISTLMSRIKGKQTNRIDHSLQHRMISQAHLPNNPSLVNRKHAYALWEKKNSTRHSVSMGGTKSYRKWKKRTGLQMDLLDF